MISIGEIKGVIAALDALLFSAHRITIRVRLLDLDHNYKQDLTQYFMDGAVTVDTTTPTTRALDIVLFDPEGKIHIDPDTASSTSVFIADMISVVYVVTHPLGISSWSIPVFTGPIDDAERDNFYLTVKCLGKETLSLTNAWQGKTYKKGQRKTDVIKNLLREQAGETKLSIPDLRARIPNDIKLTRQKSPWFVAQNIAKGMGMQLFYDGRGVATLRRRSKNPVIKFNVRNMTSQPKVSYDMSKTINAVRVIGAKPKKAKKKITYTAVAPRAHPLSPWRLGRGGQPRYLWQEIEDPSIKSTKDAKVLAKSVLEHGLLAGVEVTFDGLPHPRLQELDIARLNTDDYAVTFSLRKFTIPLRAGDVAAYGYVKRVRPTGGARGVRRKAGK
jgi:hypothetical protein